ncbi:nitrate/nitrite transporter NarK [Dysgonomonas sp. PH5-45]|uniref:MFS transporter n=1 Tax=unclassified Dysgonomonas TaxID=2630389 RepID=UPI0024752ABF|nr:MULTISPECIES: MFS transporter [unclassified Dysgonomonas]MDH6355543.1 nitrate/nitrite transporter NarK [Dysgonomonas sp. PH5-45]MDH6388440.1 nitrate/nitrite transporter NarK [Dysgonomonas sp. PH5-37]
MTNALQQKLSDSKSARFTVLALIAFTMFCGYFMTDVMAPLKPLLESQLKWTSTEFGIFTSSYAWFNVFFCMLIFSGIILDKLGVRLTGLGSCILMVIGCTFKFYAVSNPDVFQGTFNFFGTEIKMQVLAAGLGFAIFGVGIETAGITVSKAIVRWFKGKELALAMGLEMAVARLGTGLAMVGTLPLADYFKNISTPILFGLALLCIGLFSWLVFCMKDRKLDASVKDEDMEPEEPFRVKDILYIISNKGFWLIALLCVLFYSAVFPFLKYATDLVINKYGVDPNVAGAIPSILPLGTIFLTPFFGNLYDRVGKGANLMIIGAIMLIGVHVLFALPILNTWWFAALVTVILGIAFSLVPSAMWPSVPKIIPENKLGTAYALIFWVQNWGLMGVPLLIGWVLDAYCKTGVAEDGRTTYDYTLPMIIFAGFGVLALFIALLLKREDKKKGYGLQKANIEK